MTRTTTLAKRQADSTGTACVRSLRSFAMRSADIAYKDDVF